MKLNIVKIIPLLSVALLMLLHQFAVAQSIMLSETGASTDTLQTDTLSADLLYPDSLPNDTLPLPPKSTDRKTGLESKVVYSSNDSIMFDIAERRVYLFGKAEIQYEQITVTADFIEISFDDNLLYATGLYDSAGVLKGRPVFTERDQSFRADTMTYNFDTKKGFIKQVITEEGEGFLHGDKVKKMPNDEIFISSGKYTTCNLDCPHFHIGFRRAKVIPGDKIVTGPVFLYIEDVPLPLVVPFGLFPNQAGQQSGILIPTYGESANRGFFLENGGYYFGINDYVDLALRGDIYSRGSWAVKALSNYNKRYRYNGSIDLSYAVNITSSRGLPDYSRGRDFFVRWSHNQDPKAHPNRRFSANVNAGSSNYHTFNPSTTNDYLSNTFQSNVSYQTTIINRFNFSANLRHSQNTMNNTVDLSLPEIAFSANRFYPFRRGTQVGQLRWYENISMGYTMNARNEISTVDSLLFSPETLQNFRNGMRHNIPINSTLRILNHFSLNNSINYNERWYAESINRRWTNDMNPVDSTFGYVRTDTLSGFAAARDFSFSSTLNTKLYGMFQFRRGPVEAVRHVLTPSLGFSYIPNFGDYRWGYYKYHGSPQSGEPVRYSVFETGIYGSPPADRSGSINFSLANNLEMKIRTPRDTTADTRKVTLIENFTISTAYDLARDSLNLAKIMLSGRTVLFRNFDIRYAAALDPYVVDSNGRNINKFEWDVNRRLARLNNSEWALSINWNYRSQRRDGTDGEITQPQTTTTGTEEERAMIQEYPEAFIDFNIPWSINLSYTFRHRSTFSYFDYPPERENKIIQTLNFHGDVNLTPKWKIGFRSGFDFDTRKLSYTSIDVYRDLHCWELSFNWIPIGFRKSWNVTINVKASVLQDLKLTRKRDWRDAYY